jgi:hypothetical protein
MYCLYCQKDLYECDCPDLLERLRSLQAHPGWAIPDCKNCKMPLALCKCEEKIN